MNSIKKQLTQLLLLSWYDNKNRFLIIKWNFKLKTAVLLSQGEANFLLFVRNIFLQQLLFYITKESTKNIYYLIKTKKLNVEKLKKRTLMLIEN